MSTFDEVFRQRIFTALAVEVGGCAVNTAYPDRYEPTAGQLRQSWIPPKHIKREAQLALRSGEGRKAVEQRLLLYKRLYLRRLNEHLAFVYTYGTFGPQSH